MGRSNSLRQHTWSILVINGFIYSQGRLSAFGFIYARVFGINGAEQTFLIATIGESLNNLAEK